MPKQFPIEEVPLPGRTQPLQQPHHYDPATVIMQAAQQRLEQQGLQQKGMENLANIIESSTQLMEHRREALASEAHANALLELQKQMTPQQMSHLEAQTRLLNAQASMFDTGGSGGLGSLASDMLRRETLPPNDPNALPPGTTLNAFPKFGNSRLAILNAYANNPNAGFSQANINYQAGLTGAKTMQGPTFKQRIVGGESILPNFQSVVDMADQLGLSKFAAVNKIKLAALRQVNDPTVAKYDATRSAVSEEMARYFGGGASSDMKIRLGQQILGNDGADSEAMKSALLGDGGAYSVIQNQINAFKGQSAGNPSRLSNTNTPTARPIVTKKLKNGPLIKAYDNGDGTFEPIQ